MDFLQCMRRKFLKKIFHFHFLNFRLSIKYSLLNLRIDRQKYFQNGKIINMLLGCNVPKLMAIIIQGKLIILRPKIEGMENRNFLA